MKLSWIFVLGLLAIVAVFSVQNAEPITVRLLMWEITISAALVILLAAGIGGMVGLIVGALSRKPVAVEPVRPSPMPIESELRLETDTGRREGTEPGHQPGRP